MKAVFLGAGKLLGPYVGSTGGLFPGTLAWPRRLPSSPSSDFVMLPGGRFRVLRRHRRGTLMASNTVGPDSGSGLVHQCVNVRSLLRRPYCVVGSLSHSPPVSASSWGA